jgi:hypothetical protein
MRRVCVLLLALALAWTPALGATPVWVTPDVPTDETSSGAQVLPWQIFRYGLPPGYVFELSIPGDPALDAIERMDKPKNWLFSVESASNLGGNLPVLAEPRDVVRYDGAANTYSLFFCGAGAGVPLESNVDALFLLGGDSGDLVISFDVPTLVAGTFYDPADLLRYKRVGSTCSDWLFNAVFFDASTAGVGIPTSANLIGADRCGNQTVMSFDVPTSLGPPGLTTYAPGQLAAWNGATYSLFEPLAGWPISSAVDGVACAGNPGLVPSTLKVNKAAGGMLQLVWDKSCSQGATDYGIYQGTIGSWYSHTLLDCSDAGNDLQEEITPGAGNRYFLVVPYNPFGEGSYGRRSGAIERPVGTAVCSASQVLTSCP